MVSVGPDKQSYNYTHMWSFPDLRGPEEKHVLATRPDSMFNFLYKNPEFSKFTKIIQKALMAGQYDNYDANFTLFAPKDESLKSVPQEFFDNMDTGLAKQIVDASTLPRKIDKKALISSPVSYIVTRDSTYRMYVTNISGKTRINNLAEVVEYDNMLNGGIIHVVDNLIMPMTNTYMN